jgi:rRNA-processing protein FCF1
MAKARLRCALDTNFLIDLAQGDESSLVIHRELITGKSEMVITNTVIAELLFFSQKDNHELKSLAWSALKSIRQWQINTLQVSPLNKGYIEAFRDCLIKDGILDPAEKHDGEIIGEASFAEADFLITSDEEMIATNSSVLAYHFKNQHMHAVNIVSKSVFYKLFNRHKSRR